MPVLKSNLEIKFKYKLRFISQHNREECQNCNKQINSNGKQRKLLLLRSLITTRIDTGQTKNTLLNDQTTYLQFVEEYLNQY